MEQNAHDPAAVVGSEAPAGARRLSRLLLAVAIGLIAAILAWIGLQLFQDGLLQRAHPSPRAPQLGNIHLVWSAIALYLAAALLALAIALRLPRLPRRVLVSIGWLVAGGLVALAAMVPGTYVWLSRSTPEEGSIVEPGMDAWDTSDAPADDAPLREDRF